MNNFSQTLIFVTLSLCLSCQSKQDKFVQAQFDMIQGNWVIDNLVMPANAPDTLKNFYQSGELVFNSCKYSNKTSSSCGGEAEINGVALYYPYNYDYSLGQFVWQLGVSQYTPRTFNTRKAIQIFDGNWEVVVSGNKMTAKRKGVNKDYLDQATLYKGEVMFTATKK